MTERPIENQSDTIKELYSDLSIIKAKDGDFSLVYINDKQTYAKHSKNNLGYLFVDFLAPFRFFPHLWKHKLCAFVRMVDIVILLSYLPSNVPDNLWRPLWSESRKKKMLYLLKKIICGKQNPKIFLFS